MTTHLNGNRSPTEATPSEYLYSAIGPTPRVKVPNLGIRNTQPSRLRTEGAEGARAAPESLDGPALSFTPLMHQLPEARDSQLSHQPCRAQQPMPYARWPSLYESFQSPPALALLHQKQSTAGLPLNVVIEAGRAMASPPRLPRPREQCPPFSLSISE